MITNREEVIDKAFGVFLRMNYEKASIITIAKACGLTKTGIVYYFPHKLDLFVAVTDKYVLRMHEPESKFPAPADTLAEFIGQYVAGVDASMKRIARDGRRQPQPARLQPQLLLLPFPVASAHVLSGHQAEKSSGFSAKTMSFGRRSYGKRKKAGKSGATRTWRRRQSSSGRCFFGLSYEQAFLNGLNVEELEENFRHIYSLLKA